MGKAGKGFLFIMLVFLLALVACTGGSSEDASGTEDSEKTEEGENLDEKNAQESEAKEDLYSIDDFAVDKTDAGEPMDGGTLNFGVVSASAFEGVLNPIFYESTYDSEIIQFFYEKLLMNDNNYNYTQDGAATWDLTENDNGTVTVEIEIRDNVNWHDGEPVKAEDLAFAYEVIGHPDYEGVRFSEVEQVVGIDEYNAGETDSISGIEIVDEKTIRITYKDANPSLLASGIWDYPLAKHIYEDIPIDKMAESDATRVNPIGFGPFIVDTIVPGESVTFTANEEYWQGAPKLDGITLKRIPQETVVQALETGEVDIVHEFPTEQYPDVADRLTNVEFLGQIDNSYTYIGFKLGKWDADAGEVVMDPNAKMADVDLRRAMWHAVDNDAVGKQFYKGLRWNATTLIIPAFPDYHDPTIETPTYNPELAKQILDEAGYVDVDGDNFRETPDGEELVINFASMEGGDLANPLSQYYIQAWGKVGLKVELVDGRLLEFNDFYDRLEADDPRIDIYLGAWVTGYDVDQRGLYGRNAAYNYTRYASEKNDELLAQGASSASMDIEYRKDVYKQWQQLMVDEIPVFPTLYRSELVPVNERVTGWSIQRSWINYHEVGVTQDEPVLP